MYTVVELLIKNNTLDGCILRGKDDEYIVIYRNGVCRYNEIGPIIIAGSRYGFEARKGNKWVVVIDGQESKEYDWVAYLTFSPDGSRYGFVAERLKKRIVVIDGQESKGYYNVRGLRFSPDGSKYAYIVERSDYTYEVIVNDKVSNKKVMECDRLVDIDLDVVLS
jgi:hypothetical protein